MTIIDNSFGRDPHELAPKWGWFVALGVVMLLAGLFALGDTVMVTLLSVIFIGGALIVGGIFQIIHAYANKEWSTFLFGLICGAFYILGGFLIIDEPVQGSLIITIMLLIALTVGGVLRIVMALRHREIKGWWFLLLTGLLSIVLAVILYSGLPWASLWLLGTIVAVELIFHGVAWISMGFALRGMR